MRGFPRGLIPDGHLSGRVTEHAAAPLARGDRHGWSPSFEGDRRAQPSECGPFKRRTAAGGGPLPAAGRPLPALLDVTQRQLEQPGHGLHLRQASQDSQRPHPVGAHPQPLDRGASPLLFRSAPEDAGTKHPTPGIGSAVGRGPPPTTTPRTPTTGTSTRLTPSDHRSRRDHCRRVTVPVLQEEGV